LSYVCILDLFFAIIRHTLWFPSAYPSSRLSYSCLVQIPLSRSLCILGGLGTRTSRSLQRSFLQFYPPGPPVLLASISTCGIDISINHA